jgi:hypothetical protein
VASRYSILPLAANIRITYQQVFWQVRLFKQLCIDTFREQTDIVWDISLDYNNHYEDKLRRLCPVAENSLAGFWKRYLMRRTCTLAFTAYWLRYLRSCAIPWSLG